MKLCLSYTVQDSFHFDEYFFTTKYIYIFLKIDPRLIRMLNETISVEPNQEIVVIVQSMVEKLENEQLEGLENPESNEVILDECADVNAFKILPNDEGLDMTKQNKQQPTKAARGQIEEEKLSTGHS